MQETEQQRRERVVQRAWWLAMSGEMANWTEVETRLVELGFADAPRWLADVNLREKIDAVCRRVADGPKGPPGA